MKRIVCVLLVVMMLALTACSGGSAVGKYKFDKLTDASGTDYSALFEVLGLKKDDLFVELKADNKFSMNMMGESVEGTYELNGTTLKLTYQGETLEGELKNNVITFSQDGQLMTFKK